ncbi:MauE/DoxX family redox-associated membrane protein [Kitasatospora sp. NPDC097691]|uniref:MauE/DoxX family redox-associated membrane protein n=1 Tax=Kitasatospora sp. NPDC097691 TaxID=3157231 RepID=UPI00331A544D
MPAAPAGPGRGGRAARYADLAGTLARLGLAAVWFVAGTSKLADPGAGYLAVRAYQVLPNACIRPVAIGLPLLELLLGLFLLLGLGTRVAALCSGLLLLALIAAIAQSWARGLSIDCGCFGGGGEIDAGRTRYPQEIARDVGFLALALWLTLRPRTLLAIPTTGTERTEVPA